MAEVHYAHVKSLQVIAAVRGQSNNDDTLTEEFDIKEESFEDANEENIEEINFLETDEIIAQNPLLNHEEETEVCSDLEKSKRLVSKLPKQTRAKRKKPTTFENECEGEDNKILNGKSKQLPHRKSKRQKAQVREDKKKTCSVLLEENMEEEENYVVTKNSIKKDHCVLRIPKRRNGHILLQENKNLIEKHIKMKCEVCTDTSDDFQNLVAHFKQQHPDVKPHIKCCDRKLDCPSDILQHAYYHEDPEHFKCNECGKSFMNNSCLKDHYRQYHEPEENLPYACDQCPRRFSRKNLLEHHNAKHIPKTERSYFCEICEPTRA